MITLLQLDYFRKLAAVEHVTKVARELNISQTALSSMMINLEREVEFSFLIAPNEPFG